jgi:alpha-galactosidase
LRIVVGDQIALTPPMGWNSWNCFARAVSDAKVRAAADAMVKSGLIDHGWTYINVDDCWEVGASRPEEERRDADGQIKTNAKFPDMKAMADYIHSKGLRAGLYSSPGPATCGGFTASYQFEQKDAAQYAAWGFDYLKYDWCSYGKIADQIRKNTTRPTELEIFQHPYSVMRDALRQQNRDILFSFCQYGMGDVWKWGEQTGGNCWRTTGDINDSWSSMSGIGFNQNGHEKYAGPGHWNDPDMLVVGKVGWGPSLHSTHLTPNEQYTHISLWSLLAAPMLIGCDMTQMDDFTLGLLTNDEVIAVNQDALGQQAKRVWADADDDEIWARNLQDGTKAVGLFNRGDMPTNIAAKWSDLGISGKQTVRDLWRQKDLGEFDGQFSADVGRHGVVLIKVGQLKS